MKPFKWILFDVGYLRYLNKAQVSIDCIGVNISRFSIWLSTKFKQYEHKKLNSDSKYFYFMLAEYN